MDNKEGGETKLQDEMYVESDNDNNGEDDNGNGKDNNEEENNEEGDDDNNNEEEDDNENSEEDDDIYGKENIYYNEVTMWMKTKWKKITIWERMIVLLMIAVM